MEVLFGVCSAIPGLVAVSWLLIRPPRVQEPLFRCEFASVHRHCGDASNLSLLHFICFFWWFVSEFTGLSLRGSGTCQLGHNSTISSDCHLFVEALS